MARTKQKLGDLQESATFIICTRRMMRSGSLWPLSSPSGQGRCSALEGQGPDELAECPSTVVATSRTVVRTRVTSHLASLCESEAVPRHSGSDATEPCECSVVKTTISSVRLALANALPEALLEPDVEGIFRRSTRMHISFYVSGSSMIKSSKTYRTPPVEMRYCLLPQNISCRTIAISCATQPRDALRHLHMAPREDAP